MLSLSLNSPQKLLHSLAPNSQGMIDLPAHPPKERTAADTLYRLRGHHYLWDDEAWQFLDDVELANVGVTRAVLEFAADVYGCDWGRVPRQTEWRLNIRSLMLANPGLARGRGLPDWDPDDFWVPLGDRDEWQEAMFVSAIHEAPASISPPAAEGCGEAPAPARHHSA